MIYDHVYTLAASCRLTPRLSRVCTLFQYFRTILEVTDFPLRFDHFCATKSNFSDSPFLMARSSSKRRPISSCESLSVSRLIFSLLVLLPRGHVLLPFGCSIFAFISESYAGCSYLTKSIRAESVICQIFWRPTKKQMPY